MSSAANKPSGAWPSGEWNALELEVRRLLDLRDAWRQRAQAAEHRVRELESTLVQLSTGTLDPVALAARTEQLAEENQALRRRLASARERVHGLIRRLDLLQEAR